MAETIDPYLAYKNSSLMNLKKIITIICSREEVKNIAYLYLPDGCWRGMYVAAEFMVDAWSFGGDNFLCFLLHESSNLGDSKPLSSSYHEEVILVKFYLLAMLGLAMGDVHLPYILFHH